MDLDRRLDRAKQELSALGVTGKTSPVWSSSWDRPPQIYYLVSPVIAFFLLLIWRPNLIYETSTVSGTTVRRLRWSRLILGTLLLSVIAWGGIYYQTKER